MYSGGSQVSVLCFVLLLAVLVALLISSLLLNILWFLSYAYAAEDYFALGRIVEMANNYNGCLYSHTGFVI